MKEIHSWGLADLLNKRFEGECKFTGTVRISVEDGKDRSSLDSDSLPTFYDAHGNFKLTRADKFNGAVDGSYRLSNKGTELFFRPKRGEGKDIDSDDSSNIDFEIDFPVKGYVSIVPKTILY